MTYGERVWQTLLCLKRVRPAVDRMVVIVDDTVSEEDRERLRAAGAEVHHYPWTDNFSVYRNHYLERVNFGEWVLTTDPDELLTPEAVSAIRPAIERTGGVDLFLFRGSNVNGEMTDAPLPPEKVHVTDFFKELLFVWNPGVRYENRVHHTLIPSHEKGHWTVSTIDQLYYHFRTDIENFERGCRNYFIGGGGSDQADAAWERWRAWLSSHGFQTWDQMRAGLRAGHLPAEVLAWVAGRKDVAPTSWKNGEERAFYEYYHALHPEEI